MKNKNEFSISVSEPWNFESVDGKNLIKGTILSIINYKTLVFRANYPLDFEGLIGDTLVLSTRLKDESFSIIDEVEVNGGLLKIEFSQELAESELRDNCKFVLIGTLID